jgi:hypothetical protein
MSNRNLSGQEGMFVFTNRPAGGQDEGADFARWLYPCALCNQLDCEVAGTMCPACEKPRKRVASTRRVVRKAIASADSAKSAESAKVVKLSDRASGRGRS